MARTATMVTGSEPGVFRRLERASFNAYRRASTGTKLWSAPTQADVVAAPATYTIGWRAVRGRAGWRARPAAGPDTHQRQLSANNSRLLVYKLNGTNVSLPTAPAS